jgi:tetratricopeptide (TPR) repeat protein
MAGVYTDNQPDFSWLMPGETKTFSQYWYPISGIGVAHQATRDAAVHLDVEDGRLRVGVATTRRLPAANVTLRAAGAVLHEWTVDLEPGQPLLAKLPSTRTGPEGLGLSVVAQGTTVLAYEVPTEFDDTEPEIATEPLPPAETASVDELYLVGVHLAQYRHPTRSPLPYWQEALRRDPGDARVHLALADHAYRRGEYSDALAHADAAIRRLTARNGNPADTEAFYLRGLILRRLGRLREAAAAFGKAAWDGKWAHAALFESARLSAAAGDHAAALEDLATSLRLDTDDLRARALRAVCLRALGRTAEAERILQETLRQDPLDQLARTLTGTDPADPHESIDVALDLASFGETAEAERLLRAVASGDGGAAGAGNAAPIAAYLLARQGGSVDPRALDLTRAFPAGLDAHDALTAAIAADPADSTARSLLGMLLYDLGRRTEAAEHWRRAITDGGADAVTHRNAGLAAYNDQADDDAAWAHYLRARELAPRDARLLYELDQLAARLGHSSTDRLERLESERELLLSRDDLTVEYAGLLIAAGRAQEALSLLESRRFQPWEGGEGLTLAAWDAARAALGLGTATPPASLGEARPRFDAPQATLEDGSTDYFATSLPALLLFHRD